MNRPAPHPYTLLVTSGRPEEPGAPLNHGIVAASNYQSGGDHWYARVDGTPTVEAFEDLMGGLEAGRAVAFSTGMAAAAASLSLVPPGGTVVRSADIYHGVGLLLEEGATRGSWTVSTVDAGDTEGWRRAVSGSDLVWVESPTNPLLEITDLPKVCGEARTATVVVDSTFATPLGQHPLQLGADVVVHSATKFVGGHSDLMAGLAITADPGIFDRLVRQRTLHGAFPGALEMFLALRGARTLGLRMERASSNALELAQRLSGHPGVSRVRYPGLSSHPGHDAAARFMEGGGAVVSFEVGNDDTADRLLAALGVIVHATSLGGVETTAERRSGYPSSPHVPPGLVRMSVGCEYIDDLWADLDQALTCSTG